MDPSNQFILDLGQEHITSSDDMKRWERLTIF